MKMEEEAVPTSFSHLFQPEKESERIIFQDLLTMTKKQVESENQKAQEKVKDKDLKQLLVKISKLSLAELSDFLEKGGDEKLKTQAKYIKKYEIKGEGKKIEKFLRSICKEKSNYERFIPGIKVFQNSSLGAFGSVKKLKKIILDKLKAINNLTVYFSSYYPIIMFSFQMGENKQLLNLIDMLNEVPILRSKVQIIDDIFGRVYSRVDNKYYCLVKFGLEKAKDVRLTVTEKQLLSQSEEFSVMFFYCTGQSHQINFVIFDKRLRSFEFNSAYILKHRNKYPNEYQEYQLMHNQIFEENPNEQTNDLLDREELSSDEEDERSERQGRSLAQIKAQVQKLLSKDLSSFDKTIEELSEQIRIESQKDSSSDKMLQLTEQIEELEENKLNYEKVRDKVKADIQVETKDCYVIALKKLIIAQKQMESKLPIIGKKIKIFEMLKKQNLLIIEGETGSGKSTQLPQILCQFYQLFDKPDAKPVVVTQPRRLATRSLADRVAKEMGENVGGFVDYVASVGKTVNPKAKIIFKQDRLLLDELSDDPLLSNYSCLVIDQAHQRTISIDVILGLTKQLLKKRSDFKVIVTSASMDIQLFESYFKTKTLRVSGRMFPVQIAYKDYPNFREGDKLQTVKKIQKLINQQILNDESSMKMQFKGHLLCFCSGVQQITQLVRIFQRKLNKKVFTILPLHGKISPAEQRLVFEPTGKHKFIFASRIAETAITIDGVKVVIDPGQDIQLVFDQKYKISSMKLVEISQSSAKQRAGRSGRTAPGHCFRLYTEENFKQRKVAKVPEMENSSLETVVLRLKSLKIGDVISFPFISRPSTEGLKNSLQLLTLIGALQHNTGKITKIGSLLVKIPIEPVLSRAMVEGVIYEYLLKDEQHSSLYDGLPLKEMEEIKSRGLVYSISVILSLLINFSNLFFIRKQDRESAQGVKFTQFSDEEGDFFFLDNIFRKYLLLKNGGVGQYMFSKKNGSNADLRQWMTKNYLNFKSLRQSEELVEEIGKIIHSFKIDNDYFKEEIVRASEKIRKCKNFREVILSCLITSFASNLCKFTGNPHIGYTIVNQRRPVQIYGTSNLSLLGIEADWIISYDLYTNELGRLYCKVAHKVSFEFVAAHTDKFIQDKFNIQKIQEKNPFYEQVSYSLPATVISRIRYEFGRGRKDQQFQFLQQTFPMINEDTNSISFFVLVDEEANSQLLAKKMQKASGKQIFSKLKKYIKSKTDEVAMRYKHNYIGNVYLYLKDGFQVNEIQFNRREYTIEIVSIGFIVEYVLNLFSLFEKREVYSVDQKDKVLLKFGKLKDSFSFKRTILYVTEKNKEEIMDLVELLQIRFGFQKDEPIIYCNVKLLDQRKKTPRTKINLHFFAGTSKGSIYMSYKTNNDYNPAGQMLDLLQPVVRKLSKMTGFLVRPRSTLEKKTVNYGIKPQKLRLSKKGNGINLFQSCCDEFELREYLFELVKANELDFRYIFPHSITAFRDPEISEAIKTDDDWRRQIIVQMLQRDIDTEGIIINVRGYYYHSNADQIGQFQKRFRVYMTAEILGLSQPSIKKLKEEIDGKRHILGCQKTHVRVNYDQVIAIPSVRLFYGLEEEYQHNLSLFKQQFPMLSFHTVVRRIKNMDRLMIIAHSPNKQDFIKPQRILSSLYSPKLIKLQGHEYNFLDKMKLGQALLNNIEAEYNFKVYFGFEKYNKVLRVYCEDHLLNEIEQKIKAAIKQFNYYCQRISYRGKNLHKVLQILAVQQVANKGAILYQILFQSRQVQITAGLAVFQEIKNKILKLSNSQKGQCQICAQKMKNPFKLINCGCTFCWHCIAQAIRQFFTSAELVYYCPGQKCGEVKTAININDFKTLLSEQEFQKLCDLKVRKYIEQKKDKSGAWICKFCENLIDPNEFERKQQMACQICGRSWCLLCEQEHTGYTCAEWENRNQIDAKQLESMDIKKCPKCKNGVQKNKGCNHMTCQQCKAHFCWKCLKSFTTADACYNHLAKECGGIFDPGYMQ